MPWESGEAPVKQEFRVPEEIQKTVAAEIKELHANVDKKDSHGQHKNSQRSREDGYVRRKKLCPSFHHELSWMKKDCFGKNGRLGNGTGKVDEQGRPTEKGRECRFVHNVEEFLKEQPADITEG